MATLKIGSPPAHGYELPSSWAEAFCTTVDHIARFVDLPSQSLKRKDRIMNVKVQTRLIEVHALLRRVRPWFNSDQAAWAWYIGEPLVAFGRLTPAEIIKIHHEKGIEALNDWITERELGGFQ
ncbi:hypothetical protein FJM67_05040 [Maribrevibacterium harenarium]|uniref:Antitoxin Xre/MbcA/ParS-like toxin-binding domain-containing protein n=1 Tax=Maribrevibacterium harenarium TaxID=2589817 RepID=A0A501WXA0_9GAMM|nr:hypothetical protein [Maribrevibacterium harenarium]TPE54313.1 hypothetical protein FJM67_05040 [Maribrevibacterium harenarium]